MEFIVVIVVIAVIALVVGGPAVQRAKEEQQKRDEEAAEQRSALIHQIAKARTPENVLKVCGIPPPRSLRFMKSEQPVWVVHNCDYLKTKKTVGYRGGSSGFSVRVAKGVTLRSSGSRGTRYEEEDLTEVDYGTVVLTTKHIYFQGEEKERFRIRLEKLVSVEEHSDGIVLQRDSVSARPEAFMSPEVPIVATLIHMMDDSGSYPPDEPRQLDEPDDAIAALGAAQADAEQ